MELIKKSDIEYIVIACCTYKRPKQLDRMIDSLNKINYPTNIKTKILIIDNDIEESAKTVTEKYSNILNISYIKEDKKGLSNARNMALKEAINIGASHLAFIDDDEIADINWLINHIDFYNNFENIYISSGPTYKKFEGNYPDYIINNKIFKVRIRKILGKIRQTCASGNVFFPLNIIKENNIYFSSTYNNSGGEDTDFFSRLSNLGYQIGWNCNAVNFEIVDKERANLKWILKRAYNNGYINSVIYNNNRNFINKILYIINKIIILLFYIVIQLFSIIAGKTYFFNKLIKLANTLGKISGTIINKPSAFYNK